MASQYGAGTSYPGVTTELTDMMHQQNELLRVNGRISQMVIERGSEKFVRDHQSTKKGKKEKTETPEILFGSR